MNPWILRQSSLFIDRLQIHHKHKEFLFSINQIKKDKYYCSLCKDTVPNSILLQASILNKEILSHFTNNKIYVSTYHHSDIAYLQPGWDKLYLRKKEYEKKLLELFQQYNININEVV